MPEITLPEVELNIYSPKDPVEAKVVENYIVTKESSPNYVRHITFDVSGTDLEGRVRVGQSIGVLPPGKDDRGKPHKLRLYSVSSLPVKMIGESHTSFGYIRFPPQQKEKTGSNISSQQR